jgi:hypothetical protein
MKAMMPTAYEAGKKTTAKILGTTKTRRDNTSGTPGVIWCKRRKKWRTYCKIAGKQHWLGSYDDLDSATKAVREHNSSAYGVITND